VIQRSVSLSCEMAGETRGRPSRVDMWGSSYIAKDVMHASREPRTDFGSSVEEALWTILISMMLIDGSEWDGCS